jgi:hypothetical protein
MWIEKLSDGVLRVLTPVGPRYIRPQLSQRVYLLWIFRHFAMLPHQVLNQRQQKLIDALCAEHRFVSLPRTVELEDSPVLGTVEWRPRTEGAVRPPSRPNQSAAAAVAGMAGMQQRS